MSIPTPRLPPADYLRAAVEEVLAALERAEVESVEAFRQRDKAIAERIGPSQWEAQWRLERAAKEKAIAERDDARDEKDELGEELVEALARAEKAERERDAAIERANLAEVREARYLRERDAFIAAADAEREAKERAEGELDEAYAACGREAAERASVVAWLRGLSEEEKAAADDPADLIEWLADEIEAGEHHGTETPKTDAAGWPALCGAESQSGYRCAREAGHSGTHWAIGKPGSGLGAVSWESP